MKNNYQIIERTVKMFLCLAVMALAFNSCKNLYEYDLPDSNSKPDTILPAANFSYASTLDDFRTVKFTDLSTEATSYSWDFGGGNTSDEQDPTYTFDAEGTYPVTLTASDGLGQSNTVTIDVMVVEGPFQPIIVEPGFEDNTLPDGTGDGRDSWRNDLGGVIQITSSPVLSGSQGAKLPDAQDRAGYQEIIVEPNTNYDLTFWYTMKNDSADPWLTVSMVGVTQNGGTPTTPAEAQAANLASVTVNDITDPDTYVEQKLSFNSGNNNTVGIYFYNGPVEARLDDFSIEVGVPGLVPPSAGFNAIQSSTDYLEYTFENTSTNGVSYEWDFGDGFTSTDESPVHTYATPDKYEVTLVVTADNGLDATLTKTIDIQAPVTADWVCTPDPNDYRTIQFMDASVGAVELLWEFGDEYQFVGMNPSHTYMEDGIYTVKLTATSLTGLQDTKTKDITVAQGFIVQVLESGFEDNSLPDGTGDGRDSWRNSDLGGVIQITSGPTFSGSQAAKLPTSNDRIGYQRVEVEANTDYVLTFNYTMKTDPAGTLTVSILDDSVLTDPSQVAGATIASKTVNDQTDANAYVTETIAFNSGALTTVAIYFANVDVECRLDDITIQ